MTWLGPCAKALTGWRAAERDVSDAAELASWLEAETPAASADCLEESFGSWGREKPRIFEFGSKRSD